MDVMRAITVTAALTVPAVFGRHGLGWSGVHVTFEGPGPVPWLTRCEDPCSAGEVVGLKTMEASDVSSRRAAARSTRIAWRRLARRIVIGLVLIALLLTGVIWTIGTATRSITTQQQAFPATGIDTLEIDGGAGPVAIVVVNRWDVVVTTRLTDSALGRITSRPAVSGRTLRITTDCERRCLASNATADHQIAIPRALIETMDVELVAGDVRVDGFAGDVEVATSDGDIVLSHFGGEVTRLRTTRGEIAVETGDAEVRRIPGRVYAAPRSG